MLSFAHTGLAKVEVFNAFGGNGCRPLDAGLVVVIDGIAVLVASGIPRSCAQWRMDLTSLTHHARAAPDAQHDACTVDDTR